MDQQRLVNQLYPALAYARRCLETEEGRHEAAHAAVAAAVGLLRLHLPQHYVYFQPDQLFSDRRAALEDERHSLHVEPVKECAGAPESVFLCASMLARSAELLDDAILVAELFEEDAVLLALNIDGPGRFPNDVALDGFFRLSREEVGKCWTLATRDGRIDTTPTGLVLRLSGMRVPPEPIRGIEETYTRLQQAVEALSAGVVSSAAPHLDAVLLELGGEAAASAPADLARLLEEVFVAHGDLLERSGVVVERVLEVPLPPLMMNRAAMALALSAALEHCVAILPEGGHVSVSIGFDPVHSEVALEWRMTGEGVADGDDYRLAALRRVADLHRGLADVERQGRGEVLTFLMPDTVGKAVEAWIPGAHRFGERSRQMLRLVTSQPGAIPLEIVLTGVLEEELSRWLGPRLDTPLATNVARELEKSVTPLVSVEVQKKALGRVAKGKPQKELTQPKYASELLWAFRESERARKALGAEVLSQDEIERLCRALAEGTRHDEALRLLARVQPSCA
jgi:hypothetical protein